MKNAYQVNFTYQSREGVNMHQKPFLELSDSGVNPATLGAIPAEEKESTLTTRKPFFFFIL